MSLSSSSQTYQFFPSKDNKTQKKLIASNPLATFRETLGKKRKIQKKKNC